LYYYVSRDLAEVNEKICRAPGGPIFTSVSRTPFHYQPFSGIDGFSHHLSYSGFCGWYPQVTTNSYEP
jgi:hypothetical protein